MRKGMLRLILIAVVIFGCCGWNMDAYATETVLTIANLDEGLQDDRMSEAIQWFEELHPDISVEFIDLEYGQINTILMAKDSSVDILNISMASQEPVISAGAILDLNGYPQIVDGLDEWNNAAQILLYDDVLYGVPCNLFATVLYEKEALTDGELDDLDREHWTWLEFLETALSYNGDVDSDGNTDIWFMREWLRLPAWVDQYISQFGSVSTVVFDTPEFRQLAEKYRLVVQSGKIIDMADPGASHDNTMFETYSLSSPAAMQSSMYALPLLADERINPVVPKTLAVNISSDDKELAVELLAYYISPEVQLLRNQYYLADLTIAEEYGYMSDKRKADLHKGMDLFGDLKLSLLTETIRKEVFGDLLLSYWAGEINTDGLVDQLQRRLHMVSIG